MAGARDLRINILGTDRSRGALRGVSASLATVGASARRLTGLLGPLAGVASFAGLVRGALGAVRSFQAQEKAVASLNATLRLTGQFSDELSSGIQQTASAIQAVTVFGDETLVQASATIGQLATTLSGRELADAQRAVVGLAAAFDMDLASAAQLLGKAVGSTTNALRRYGVEVDTSASESQKLAQILGQTGGFFALAEAQANTSSGALKQLANAWDDLQEAIGGVLVSGAGLRGLARGMTTVLQQITTIAGGSTAEIRQLFGLLGIIAGNAFAEGVGRALAGIPDLWAAAVKAYARAFLPDALADLISAPTRGFAEGMGKIVHAALDASIAEASANVRGALLELEALATEIAGRTKATLGAVADPAVQAASRIAALREELAALRPVVIDIDVATGSTISGALATATQREIDRLAAAKQAFAAVLGGTPELLAVPEIDLRVPGLTAGQAFASGVAEGMEGITTAAQRVGEDLVNTFAEFLTTGEGHFRDFVQSVLRELNRLAVSKLFSGLLGGLLGAIGGGGAGGAGGLAGLAGGVISKAIPGAQHGANVGAGSLTMVGEAGPEIFQAGRSGQIRPLVSGMVQPPGDGETPAVVQLPAARGGGDTVVHVTQQFSFAALDPGGMREMILQQRHVFSEAVLQVARQSRAFRVELSRG